MGLPNTTNSNNNRNILIKVINGLVFIFDLNRYRTNRIFDGNRWRSLYKPF
jgi:hypothetical protein